MTISGYEDGQVEFVRIGMAGFRKMEYNQVCLGNCLGSVRMMGGVRARSARTPPILPHSSSRVEQLRAW